jgi:arabinose-5-phosphate isomerase
MSKHRDAAKRPAPSPRAQPAAPAQTGPRVAASARESDASSLDTARRVLQIEAKAIQDVQARLDEKFLKAVDLLFACNGRVAVSGMGKSGLIGRKISATLSSTGTPSFFLHPAEALHGDLGMLARGDAMLAVSYGGETQEIIQLLEALKRLEMPLVTLTGNLGSTLAEASEVALDVSVSEEACSLNLAPTASTTVAMAVGDALAVALLNRRGFRQDDFAALHPAGRLGKKLLRVEHLMHSADALPRVSVETSMPDAFHEMSRKGLGMTTVLEGDGRLAGIITDGDLRRLMEKHRGAVLEMNAGACMTRTPQTIGPHLLASEALNLMEKRKITSIVVVDDARRALGVVHLHDLWTLELI